MGKASGSYADPKSSSSRDTSNSTNYTKSSSGNNSSSSSGSKNDKPEIHNHPDGKRDGYKDLDYRRVDQRYHIQSGLSDAYGGSKRR